MNSAFLFFTTLLILFCSVVTFHHKMSYKVEKISGPFELGEGPHWDDDRQALYFVDAFTSTIGRYLPDEDRTTLCKLDDNKAVVSIIIPVKGDTTKFIATIGPDVVEVSWDGETETPDSIRVLASVKNGPGQIGTRFNDGKIDPQGRLWIGTMGNAPNAEGIFEPVGSLYSFDQTKKFAVSKHVDGISIANGLAWSADKKMYYIDTPTKKVDVFDFDATSGKISNRRVIYDFADDKAVPDFGGPDGMTIDTDGNLWVAVFGAGAVYNINPQSGELLRKVAVPSPNTTSVAFGGPNRDELYVVSASALLSEELLKSNPLAGSTFRVTGLGVSGHPMKPVQL